MKKILFSCIVLAFACNAFAQGPADALLYSTNSYTGTARSLSMGNAFVALGGDIGAMAVNPASSAVYRHSEVSITPALLNAGSSSAVLGCNSNESFTAFKLTSVGFIIAFDTNHTSGLFNFDFGICVNRIADFNKTGSARWTTSESSFPASIAARRAGTEAYELAVSENYNPYSDSNLPWPDILAFDTYLISPYPVGSTNTYIGATQNGVGNTYVIGGPLDQSYFSKSVGGVMEYAINLGFNISDILYLGVNLNLHSLSYEFNSYYSEASRNSKTFDDGFVSMSNNYYLRTTGIGFNAEFGAIVTPIAGLRIGATFTTPTLYRLNDTWNYNMTASFDNGKNPTEHSPTGANSYRLNVPIKWSLGVAYTFEDFALVSVDWESVNNSKLFFANTAGNKVPYDPENQRIANGFRSSSNLRAGLEVRPTDKLYLRGGYNLITSGGNLVDSQGMITYTYPDTHYASAGIGYRFGLERAFSLDFAYQRQIDNRESYSVYGGSPTIDAMNYLNRFLLTFAYRF